MSLLPVDTDALEDICRSVAMSNYGFLYVTDKRGEIQNSYESADTGTLNTSNLSTSDLKKALRSLTEDEFSDLEQIRDGVYYVDTFSVGSSDAVTNELTSVFSQRIVITSETLRSRFDLAIDDVDYFASELESRDLVARITAGERDYYTIGPRLKEHAGNVGLDSQLERKAARGKISHSDLEKVIDVAATTDVIRYLEQEGFIVDLDGEYLVKSALDEFARYVASETESEVEAHFEGSQYLVPTPEFPGVVRSEIEARFDVLSQAHGMQDEIVGATQDALADRLDLEVGREMVVMRDEFDAYVDGEARRVLTDVKSEHDVLPASPTEFEEAASEHVEEMQVSNDPSVNRYVREAVEGRYAEVVAEQEFGGVDT